MPFDLGDTVRLTAECTDADGTLTNAASATLTLTLPDGTTESPSVPEPSSAGLYSIDLTPTVPGRHLVRWKFTGPESAYTDVFDVRPAEPALIVSLADAKAHLNIPDSRDDDEIRGWLEAVTEIVENYVGNCIRRSFTERFRLPLNGKPAIALTHTPVLEITDIVGADLAAIELYAGSGVIYNADRSWFGGTVDVTYTAGRPVIPANITKAALIILQHLWQTQRNSPRGGLPGVSEEADVIPGVGYAVPNRAVHLMAPHMRVPGVA